MGGGERKGEICLEKLCATNKSHSPNENSNFEWDSNSLWGHFQGGKHFYCHGKQKRKNLQ